MKHPKNCIGFMQIGFFLVRIQLIAGLMAFALLAKFSPAAGSVLLLALGQVFPLAPSNNRFENLQQRSHEVEAIAFRLMLRSGLAWD